MSENVKVSVSQRGKKVLIVNCYTYRLHKKLAGNNLRWCCCKKSCTASLKTADEENPVTIFDANLNHNHEVEENVINRKHLSNTLKRKAKDDICEKPSKLIHRELMKNDISTLTTKDVELVRRCMYNSRRSLQPKLPTSTKEVHELLENISVTTNKGENFVAVNDKVKNIVMFTCLSNLVFLCTLDTIYVDGKFKGIN